MKRKWKEMKEKWGSLVLAACLVLLFYLVLSNLGIVWGGIHSIFRVFVPIFIGVAIAYILNPFAKFNDRRIFGKMKNRKWSWYLSVALAFVLLLVFIALILYILIPELIGSVITFVDNFEGYLVSLQRLIDSLNLPESELVISIKELISNEGTLIGRALNLLASNIGKIIQGSSSFTAGTVNIVMGFILAIYLLGDKKMVLEWIQKGIQLVAKDRHYNNFSTVGHRFNSIFAKYIACELIDALIVGVVNYIAMSIFRMPYAMVVSVVVGVANLVPTFGPIVGAAIGIIILLLANPIKALWFLVLTIILQIIDAYYVKPKIFGDVLNVPGILIMFAIIIFGRIFGMVGIFLSIPLAAIIVYIIQEYIVPRLEARKAKREVSLLEQEDGILK